MQDLALLGPDFVPGVDRVPDLGTQASRPGVREPRLQLGSARGIRGLPDPVSRFGTLALALGGLAGLRGESRG